MICSGRARKNPCQWANGSNCQATYQRSSDRSLTFSTGENVQGWDCTKNGPFSLTPIAQWKPRAAWAKLLAKRIAKQSIALRPQSRKIIKTKQCLATGSTMFTLDVVVFCASTLLDGEALASILCSGQFATPIVVLLAVPLSWALLVFGR